MKYPKMLIFKTSDADLVIKLNDVNYVPSMDKFRATIFIPNSFVNFELNNALEFVTEEKEF